MSLSPPLDFMESLNPKGGFFKNFPCKWLIRTIRKDVLEYSKTFSNVLGVNLCTEFPLKIEDGNLTEESEVTILKLGECFHYLQFKKNIHSIF